MLASVNYPVFEHPTEISASAYTYDHAFSPVREGHFVSFNLLNDLSRWQHFYNGAEIRGPFITKNLFARPLVIAFYSNYWGKGSLEQLKHFNEIQHEIKAYGGNLLVIADERDIKLEKLAWEHSLSLNFYFDTDGGMAEKFRVYPGGTTAWNRLSVIDPHIHLPAVYVLNAARQVVYHHIDHDLQGNYPEKDIINAVHQAVLADNKRSA
ncbi:hypothetical protein GCM10023149_11220 [Mucilaginibacter gynuensis]|uniref:Alkyl hydroperoxide reductase subunit C/ Thiol specific antioxidant domain-containing protein n=1 Tax=Mucilaginibacter gynuensis TaxID=1302236 RepID=A0ABP8G0M4_9SPHI